MEAKWPSEKEISHQVKSVLKERLADYEVSEGKAILYNIEVNAFGKITPKKIDNPTKGQFAFQTDILIEKEINNPIENKKSLIPLVVLELKSGLFSSHDVITYSSKARRHKDIYPYLRYGFVVVGPASLGGRFVTHNQAFDFAMAFTDVATHQEELVALALRQIKSAERICELMRSEKIQISRYEENVEIISPGS
jgi:hypothetical protein